MKKANCGDCCGGLGWDQLRGGWWWTVEEDGGNLEEEEATIVSWPPWRWRADGLMMAEERERDGNSFIVGGCYGDNDEDEGVQSRSWAKIEIKVVKGRKAGSNFKNQIWK
jgi:hypothetical protein